MRTRKTVNPAVNSLEREGYLVKKGAKVKVRRRPGGAAAATAAESSGVARWPASVVGDLAQNWKRRYFRLHKGYLLYYKDEHVRPLRRSALRCVACPG